MHQVKLGIFPPHLHIKFIKFGVMVIIYELNHFSMLIKHIKENIILSILNMHESDIL